MQYIESDGREHLYTLNTFDDRIQKKVTLLKYFRGYMQEHLLRAGDRIQVEHKACEEMTRLPFLSHWFRTRHAIVLLLSNGIIQVVTPINLLLSPSPICITLALV